MMRKVLRGLLVMGAALAVSVGAASYDASAATLTVTNITVDYANQQMTVKSASGKDGKIYVAPTTVTKKKDKVTEKEVITVKLGAETEYDLGSTYVATVDLSSFSVAKEQYLSVWGNGSTDPLLIQLSPAKTKLKAVVDAVSCQVTINDVTDSKNPVEVTGIEYCTTNGNWADYVKGTTDLTKFAPFGATLRFRVKGAASKALAAANAVTVGTDADGNTISAYQPAGCYASNELKAKIAKTANGPKATIDYNARTIKVANTTEYRFSNKAAALKAMGTFTPALDGEIKTITLNADTVVTGEGEFDLRTAATATKPASKITEYKFNAIGAVAPKVGTSVLTTSKAPTFYDVTGTVVDSNVKVTKLTLDSKTMVGKMTIENSGTDDYQIIVEDIQQDAATIVKLVLPTATAKVTGKVAAGRTAVIPVKSGQYVYVSKAGNAKTAAWSTPYAFVGQVMNTLD